MRRVWTCWLAVFLLPLVSEGAAAQDCADKIQEWIDSFDQGDRSTLMQAICDEPAKVSCDADNIIRLLGEVVIPLQQKEANGTWDCIMWFLTANNFSAVNQYLSEVAGEVGDQGALGAGWKDAKRKWLTPTDATIALNGWTNGEPLSVRPGSKQSYRYEVRFFNYTGQNITSLLDHDDFPGELQVGIARESPCSSGQVSLSQVAPDLLVNIEAGQSCLAWFEVRHDGELINDIEVIEFQSSQDAVNASLEVEPPSGIIPFDVIAKANVEGVQAWSYVLKKGGRELESTESRDSTAFHITEFGTYEIQIRSVDREVNEQLDRFEASKLEVTAFDSLAWSVTPKGGLPGVTVSAEILTPKRSLESWSWFVGDQMRRTGEDPFEWAFDKSGEYELKLQVDYPDQVTKGELSQWITVEENPSLMPVIYGGAGIAVAGLTWLVIHNTADDAAEDAWGAYEASGPNYDDALFKEYSEKFDSRTDSARNIGIALGAVAVGYTIYAYLKREGQKEEIRDRYNATVQRMADGQNGLALVSVGF